ncbi:DExH-box ATP-dependent RNA helicase DExH15 chloroplastic isoform X2 [Oryza brachyantha]|uniref:DExH-box ATP-dependent RNA helicase DExH15 chloroplastic isoform X2 n=1 Tax=Oryza brachyantha TaxID=4533 RepID=UPI001ADBED9C|nr:DExH-box ATP-dependent RNA helicase DExH15 chloroplastic isoform X2 [Oryza brachyantha]
MHCLAPHFLLLLPLPSSAPRHALPQASPAPLLLPSHPAQVHAAPAPLHLPSARSPSRAAAPVSDDDEDEEADEEDDDEVDIRDADAEADEEYDDEDYEGEEGDEELDEESGGEDEEEGDDGEEEDVRDESAARRRKSEEYKYQRVGKLVAEVREFGEDIIDYNELAGIYDFRIDKFQRLAIQAFLRGSSVVVSAPTSSGKTLIAEAAAVATVARGRRLFYTTPLKALSNQKFRDFRNTFGDHNVGLLTGDSAINKDAQILIMTTEILRNMLYQSVGMTASEGRLFQVDVIVLDEVHYLSDISRGTVWEETVIYCPKEVQLICLSATVANPDELAGWIGQGAERKKREEGRKETTNQLASHCHQRHLDFLCSDAFCNYVNKVHCIASRLSAVWQIHGKTELVTSNRRPVPLTWHFSKKYALVPLLDGKGKKMNRKLRMSHFQNLSSPKSEYYYVKGKRKLRTNKNEQGNRSPLDISKQVQLSKHELTNMRRSQVPLIRDTLSQLWENDMLPAIWFIFSRRGCDAAVEYLEDCRLLHDCEASEVELELKRFRLQYPDAIRESAVKGLLRGVAAHHAGCLPLWKSFIEELFQRGLVKVVFATETLAAGINMPARTAVISSLSKRIDAGRQLLTPNELFQMAGRAGRRGIDTIGHSVLVQTTYEGPEDCCDVIFAGLEPLVSQFTASYGMVLNLLAGSKVTHNQKESDDVKVKRSGRTLEEARKLVEQSFGNYVGSNVMVAAKEELERIQNEIQYLSSEITDESVDQKCREELSEEDYTEISLLQKKLKEEKQMRNELKKRMELERMAAWKIRLEEFESGHLPFMCLQYKDKDSVQHTIPAVFIGSLSSFADQKILSLVEGDSLVAGKQKVDSEGQQYYPSYYVALSSDNSWYLFTEKWIKAVYRTGLPSVPSAEGDPLPRETLKQLLLREDMVWDKIAKSEYGSLLCMDGSLDTWSWSLNVPVLNSLSEDDEVERFSHEHQDAVECYKQQRRKVSQLKKTIRSTKGFKEFQKIIDMRNFTKEKIERLEARSRRLTRRIRQIEPTGWKEFLQISKIIQEARALDINTQVIYPLGETAAAIRGENELWLAMVLRNKILLDLKPSQLAAICGSLVSEGIKLRPWKNSSYVYEPSSVVTGVINYLEEQRNSLVDLQEKHGVKIPCEIDAQFAGMVEAWASGLTWREIMMDSAMDDGDLARLLRRTIDLLAQLDGTTLSGPKNKAF